MLVFREWWCGLLGAMTVAATFGIPTVRVLAAEPKAAGMNPAMLRTATVARGNLMITVNAMGTIEPTEVVDVGSPVTGTIGSLGADPRSSGKSIDYGSQVEKGTLLAQIDDAMYKVQVELARATCMRAAAELAQTKAKLALATTAWQRAQSQIQGKSISASALDDAKCTYEVAHASVDVAEATVAQGKTALKQAEINLGCTRIRSPINGIVIDRRVNVGQSVTGPLNAASLFLIAADLKELQVWVSVNEADIGRIRVGQAARFTVDTFPSETFHGEVKQIRLNATMTQNVVTYTVVVAVDNRQRKLLPYLTANVQFEVGRRNNVLLVPNAALRWQPQPQWIVPDVRERTFSDRQKPAGRDVPPGETTPQRQKERCRVWIRDGKFVRPIVVQVGLSNGMMTEIVGGDATEGMEIIVGGSIAMTEVGQGATTWSPSITDLILRQLFTHSPSNKAMQQAIASMGTNQLLVLPGRATSGGISFGFGTATLTPRDAEEIARRCPTVIHVAPIVRARAQVVYGNRNWVPYLVQGTTPSFLAVRDWEEMAEGAAFIDSDVRNANKVCRSVRHSSESYSRASPRSANRFGFRTWPSRLPAS